MTAQEARELFKANALKAGLTEDVIKGTLDLWGSNESFGKVVLDTFVPRPEVDRALSDSRTKVEEATKTVSTWKDWYEKQAKPAYEQNIKSIDRLKKYEQTYGELDAEASNADKGKAAAATGLTKEEVETMLRERDGRIGSVLKTVTDASVDHYIRFKEKLNLNELEKFAIERGLPPDAAYEQFIQPRVTAQTTAEWEAKVKAAREEGARDALSRAHLPTESRSKTPHMIFDADQLKIKDGVNPDRASREAFLDGYANYEKQEVGA